jgi:hypothetical protein
METLKDIAAALILAGVCAIGAWLLRARRQAVLALTAELIQKAEQAISGSGLGAEKKALVIAQLEAAGVKANAWLDGEIDSIVAWLNRKSAWYANCAVGAAGALAGTAAE